LRDSSRSDSRVICDTALPLEVPAGAKRAGACPARFHVGVPSGQSVALVVEFPPPCQGELYFRSSLLEVDGEGYQGERVLIGLLRQVVYLLVVQEKLAAPVGVDAAEAVSEKIRGYVHAVQPDFPVLNASVAVSQLGLAFPQRLNFASGENDPGLESFDDLVVVAGAPILGDRSVLGVTVALLRRLRHAETTVASSVCS